MTLLPWIAFAGLAAGTLYLGWNVNRLWIPVGWQDVVAIPFLLCGALGVAFGLADASVRLALM